MGQRGSPNVGAAAAVAAPAPVTQSLSASAGSETLPPVPEGGQLLDRGLRAAVAALRQRGQGRDARQEQQGGPNADHDRWHARWGVGAPAGAGGVGRSAPAAGCIWQRRARSATAAPASCRDLRPSRPVLCSPGPPSSVPAARPIAPRTSGRLRSPNPSPSARPRVCRALRRVGGRQGVARSQGTGALEAQGSEAPLARRSPLLRPPPAHRPPSITCAGPSPHPSHHGSCCHITTRLLGRRGC
jgi:hypothetical protein